MTSASPRILYVSPCLPIANGTGSQKRSSVAVEALRLIGEVFYLAVPPTGNRLDPAVCELFQGVLTGESIVAVNPRLWRTYQQPGRWARVTTRAWITAGEMAELNRKQTLAVKEAVRASFGSSPFDLIYVFQAHAGLFMVEAARQLLSPEGKFVVDWDAAERVAARDQYRFRQEGLKASLSSFINDRKLARFEHRLLAESSITICASDYDIAYFRNRRPDGTICAIPNCIDVPDSRLAPRKPDSIQRVLFVGLINYWPNRHGLLLFLKHIWPIVRQTLPKAEFCIVGRGVTPDVQAWDKRDGVQVVGEVDRVAPYYENCDVAVAPMLFSVGSSIKILESLAFNRPMVAFEASTKRHSLKDDQHISVATSEADFATRLIHLLQHPEYAHALAENGYNHIATEYSRKKIVRMTTAILI